MKKYYIVFGIIVLLLIAITVRIVYARLKPEIVIFADGQGYYRLGQIMIQNPSVKTIINPYRPPLYPIFLASVVKYLNPSDNVDSPYSFPAVYTIASIQPVVAILSIGVLFFTLLSISLPLPAVLLFCLLQSVNPLLFIWERNIMSEGVYISLGTIVLCLSIQVLRRPKIIMFCLLTISCIAMFLIRPAFITVPLGLFPVIALYHKKARIVILSSVSLSLCLLAVLLFSFANKVNYSVFVTQTIGPISNFGKILYEKIPISSAQSVEPLYGQVNEYRNVQGEPDAFAFFNYFGITNFNEPSYLAALEEFNSKVTLSHLPLYVQRSSFRLPFLLTTGDDVDTKEQLPDTFLPFYRILIIPITILQYLSLGVIIFFPIACIRFLWKKVTFKEAVFTLCGAYALVQLVPIILMLPPSTNVRYLATFFIPLTLFCCWWWAKTISFAGKKIVRLKRYIAAK